MRPIDADKIPYVEAVKEETLEPTGMFYARREDIRALPAIEPQLRWIPCSERLPEALQEVIVTSTSGYVYTSRIVHGEFEYGGNVVAWMPLPEPYRER